ncbi:MAG: GSCFA domain-containing protein [Bacteroidaceae bacterium]|nr:GSCFA domain-containing protein [Bacteroidaceae bacterium]
MKYSSEAPLFRTVVDLPQWPFRMFPADGFVFLGSCFAQHVGSRFADYGMQATVNPLGVLYNPFSIERVIMQTVQPCVEPYIFQHEGQFRCWLAGTQYFADTAEGCAAQIRETLSGLRERIANARYVFITLGTNVVYRHKQLDAVVCNCHRVPQQAFIEERIPLHDCTESLLRTVKSLLEINPDIRLIFTISPYRYAKYGYHRSQLSKSVLLLAVQAVCDSFPDVCYYFPSYEILLDELRDYRFYAEDMLHPSAQAIEYIWSRLAQCAFSTQTMQYLKEYEPIRKGLLHRPLQANAEEEKARRADLECRAAAIRQKYGISL